jgi:5-methyltetrahydropteroyltriglutamate--homocysteine methyltransferase
MPANLRHEHEWRVWQLAKLLADKILMPSVVSHATNPVEHQTLVADRMLRSAAIVGASTSWLARTAALGGRVYVDLAWAKPRTLVEGARLASTSL